MPKTHDDDLVMNLVDLTATQTVDNREAWLLAACRGDMDLFRQVWHYVEWNERMRGFLTEPLFPALPDRRLEPGDLLLDRFRIIGEVGEGGMGVVYAAEDLKLGRRIALKCAKGGFRKMLAPEALNASEISHPNVCKIFEIHTTPTPHGEIDFLTMEFLKGETLAGRLKHGPLPEAEARAIARQICAGLAEAHRKGVVHGDLKSNNVILTRDANGDARAVITDFGLARRPMGPAAHMADRGVGESQAGGTPDYMAPELWRGEKPTMATDVYAFGVMLYELASSRRPFSKEVSWQERVKLKPRAARRGWDPIVQRCMEADPARRYRDAGEVAPALEPSRARLWWLAAAAAVLLVAGAALVTNVRDNAPKVSVRLAMLPLGADRDLAGLAADVSRDAVADLGRLRGDRITRLTILPKVSGATHVVSGTIARQEGKVVVHVSLTDTKNQTSTGDWKAEYAPNEVRYAAAAITGMVTEALHVPPLAMPPVNAKAMQNYVDGLNYTRRNSTVDKALPLLERAVKADPDSPLTWAGLAEGQWFKYFITKDPNWRDRFSDSLRRAQDRNLDLAPVHRVAGLLLANAGSYAQAEMEYRRAIEIDSGNADAHRRLGMAYVNDNRSGDALVEFKKAVELAPKDFKPHQDLGGHYERSGDEREAVAQYKFSVDLAPDESDPHRALGSAYLILGRYPEAEQELRKAVELAEMPAALGTLGYTLMYLGRDRDAIEFLKRAILHAPDDSLWWMDLGVAQGRVHMLGESGAAFRRGRDLAENEMLRDPKDGEIKSRLAFLSARLGDVKEAATQIKEALHLSPDSSTTLETAVWTYEALGMHEEALNTLRSSPDGVLLDVARWPDLAELHENPRFKELLASRRLREN